MITISYRDSGYSLSGDRDVLERFIRCEAVVSGHFILASDDKMHTGCYFEKSRVFLSVEDLLYYGRKIASEWKDEGIEAVVGPAVAGIGLATAVATELYRLTGEDLLLLYTEKNSEGKQILKRNGKSIAGKKILVVEDVGTTGGSVAATIEQCRLFGPKSIVCHILLDRSGGKITAESLQVEKLSFLAAMDAKVYHVEDEEGCPYCRNNDPIDKDHGHG